MVHQRTPKSANVRRQPFMILLVPQLATRSNQPPTVLTTPESSLRANQMLTLRQDTNFNVGTRYSWNAIWVERHHQGPTALRQNLGYHHVQALRVARHNNKKRQTRSADPTVQPRKQASAATIANQQGSAGPKVGKAYGRLVQGEDLIASKEQIIEGAEEVNHINEGQNVRGKAELSRGS